VTREEWLLKRTFDGSHTDPEELTRRTAGTRPSVSVVIPALNVAPTIGAICAAIRAAWMGPLPLVDELVVMDSSSTDDTAAIATAAGARVVQDREVLPSVGAGHGKGEAMWKSLAATSGDIVVWIDGDIDDFDAAFVPKLLAPLLDDPAIGYVKAFYQRPLGDTPDDGGRVTEICARPLINRFFPDLAGFIQPLSGEAAGRRELLLQVPFLSGYAVEMGLLIDILDTVGLDAMAQVDLGIRHHANQPTAALGRMAYEITHAVLCRTVGDGAVTSDLRPYARPVPRGGGYVLDRTSAQLAERLPMATVLAGQR
jgi:glucosyl-3-phosphoglycerate synthase